MIEKIMAWSWSRLSTYLRCPFLAKLKFIKKLTEPIGQALVRGSDIHKKAERYVTGQLKKMPPELKLFKKEFTALKKQLVTVEQQWAFDKKWKPCSWFGKDAYCRMVIDAYYQSDETTLIVIDYKTGKIREENMQQLDLYALGGFLKFPEVETISCEFWYLDQEEVRDRVYKRKDLKKLQTKWSKMAKPMLNDTKFAPRPGDACRWCHFKASNGGPCEY